MLLIVHQCFLMTLSRKIIARKAPLQTTNKFFKFGFKPPSPTQALHIDISPFTTFASNMGEALTYALSNSFYSYFINCFPPP